MIFELFNSIFSHRCKYNICSPSPQKAPSHSKAKTAICLLPWNTNTQIQTDTNTKKTNGPHLMFYLPKHNSAEHKRNGCQKSTALALLCPQLQKVIRSHPGGPKWSLVLSSGPYRFLVIHYSLSVKTAGKHDRAAWRSTTYKSLRLHNNCKRS